MASSSSGRLLRDISTRQFLKYLGRTVWHSPAATRAVAPKSRMRVPETPGLGVFLYPPDAWVKTAAMATGPLGRTSEVIHPTKVQFHREIAPEGDGGDVPTMAAWGEGGGMRVIKNLISGVSEGFAVNLELHGVGYRAEADQANNQLVLRLGLSHTVELPLDDGDVFFNVLSPQLLQVAGINRGKVHQMASKVRALRKPEPYKGKGVRYQNEVVRLKESKKD